MRRTWKTVAAAMLFSAVATAPARGDGLPVGGIDAGRTGVRTEAGPDRYVTLRAAGDTLVARVRRDGGVVSRSRLLPGRFTIPAVALDGSPSGLSGDGGTLALINPRMRFPRERTAFAVLDARTLRLRQRLELPGDFSFDALSPDGTLLYLIRYRSRRDPTQYAVRVYDLGARRLLPDPIVDPSEPDERMAGYPLTRLADPPGRWHYTLYDGAGGEPFIHALDSAAGVAACIDLPLLRHHADLYGLKMRLRPGGDLAVVEGGGKPVALVDLESHSVREPAAATAPAAPREAPDEPPLWAVAAGALLLLALGAAAVAALRAARGRGEDDLPPLDAPALDSLGDDTAAAVAAGDDDDNDDAEEIAARVRVG